ncbi:MAG TPA: hypothetical protein VI279_09985 [Rhodocyclaceae bacterium]
MKPGDDICSQGFESETALRQRTLAALPAALERLANADHQGPQHATGRGDDESILTCCQARPPADKGKSWFVAMLERLGRNFHF